MLVLSATASILWLLFYGFYFVTSFLWLLFCAFYFAAFILWLLFCGFYFATSTLWLLLCAFYFAPSTLRLLFCSFYFAASILQLLFCSFYFVFLIFSFVRKCLIWFLSYVKYYHLFSVFKKPNLFFIRMWFMHTLSYVNIEFHYKLPWKITYEFI